MASREGIARISKEVAGESATGIYLAKFDRIEVTVEVWLRKEVARNQRKRRDRDQVSRKEFKQKRRPLLLQLLVSEIFSKLIKNLKLTFIKSIYK